MHERSKLKSNKKMPLLTVFLQPWCWYASCCPGKALPAQNLISWGSDPCQEECCLPWYHGGRWPAGLLHEDTWAHSRRRCIFSLLFSSLIGYYYGNCLKDMIMMLQRFRVLRTKRITNSPWFENLVETDFFFLFFTKEGLCKTVVLQVIVDQHFLISLDAAAMQFHKIVMVYVGYDTQLI